MSQRRLFAVITVVGALGSGCGPKRLPSQPLKPTLVVLLPDPGTAVTGRARVTNEFGSIDLAAARDAVTVRPDRRPGPVTTLGEEEIARLFGSAFAAMPPAARRFTLRFSFESDELTEESRELMPEILESVKTHPFPEVAIVGHTDTMGDVRANVALGLKRATTVQRLLEEAGVDTAIIEVSSHGEADPLVRTPNNTPEPRNRRVEIVVR
jgi:outer membrane protein OmpA-like peptidoglycan-associated protein